MLKDHIVGIVSDSHDDRLAIKEAVGRFNTYGCSLIIHAGDYIEVVGKLVKIGNSSRTSEVEARKVVSLTPVDGQPSAADALEEPVIVARATIIAVVPKECQRYS